MSRRREPRRVQVDGADFVLLPVDDYERLAATRRQVGAHADRVRHLRQKVAQLVAFLERLEHGLGERTSCNRSCLRTELANLLVEHRDTSGQRHGG